jgi:predicted RNase H-like nuclease (RuvC/YqgF family)
VIDTGTCPQCAALADELRQARHVIDDLKRKLELHRLTIRELEADLSKARRCRPWR